MVSAELVIFNFILACIFTTRHFKEVKEMILPFPPCIWLSRHRSGVSYFIVGIAAAALDRLGGELGPEGFWVNERTTDHWVNEPGTYSYPDSLRETTDAA